VLLGSHPPILPVRSIVRTTELFGISEGTTRVALSRLAADQDVVAEGGQYRLSDRLLARQRRLDEGRVPVTRPWRGGWEMAVVASGVRGAAGRAAAGAELAALRLGELRNGVWARPANLRREWPASLRDLVWRFEVRPLGPAFEGASSESDASGRRSSRRRAAGGPSLRPWPPTDANALTAGLWDLKGWAGQAEALLGAFSIDQTPAQRFVIAAAMVRHLQTDPLLPASLLPDRWPGPRLRQAYAGYEREMVELLRREQRRYG
jgi:phenylacetic acid degradation operon negative regulatory protein